MSGEPAPPSGGGILGLGIGPALRGAVAARLGREVEARAELPARVEALAARIVALEARVLALESRPVARRRRSRRAPRAPPADPPVHDPPPRLTGPDSPPVAD